MDLTKFNETYRITSQEPVDLVYDIILRDDMGEFPGEKRFEDLINSYEQQDDTIWRNEPINYYIYEGVTEVFYTTSESELLDEVKRLTDKLNLKDVVISEGQAYKQLKKLLEEDVLVKQTELEDWSLMNYEGFDELVLGFIGNEDREDWLVDYEIHFQLKDGIVEVEIWKENELLRLLEQKVILPEGIDGKVADYEDFIDILLDDEDYKDSIILVRTNEGITMNDDMVSLAMRELNVNLDNENNTYIGTKKLSRYGKPSIDKDFKLKIEDNGILSTVSFCDLDKDKGIDYFIASILERGEDGLLLYSNGLTTEIVKDKEMIKVKNYLESYVVENFEVKDAKEFIEKFKNR